MTSNTNRNRKEIKMSEIIDVVTDLEIVRYRDGVVAPWPVDGAPVALGDTYTTTKSGVTGIVREIVANATGSWRVRLETATGDDRWTTIVS
jgi:hypothetical protein